MSTLQWLVIRTKTICDERGRCVGIDERSGCTWVEDLNRGRRHTAVEPVPHRVPRGGRRRPAGLPEAARAHRTATCISLFPSYQSIRLLPLPLVFVFALVLSTAAPKLELLFSLLERLDALGCPSPTPCALALETPWHPLPS